MDPFPKPSYLFALVAGRFVAREERITTASGRPALLQVGDRNSDDTDNYVNLIVRQLGCVGMLFSREAEC